MLVEGTFFNPFFLEKQEKLVASKFKAVKPLNGTELNIYAHGLCLIIAKQWNFRFSPIHHHLIAIEEVLPSYEFAIDYASRSFYHGLSEKAALVNTGAIRDLVVFFKDCERNDPLRKRLRSSADLGDDSSSSSSSRPLKKARLSSDDSRTSLKVKKIQVLLIEGNLIQIRCSLSNELEFIAEVGLEALFKSDPNSVQYPKVSLFQSVCYIDDKSNIRLVEEEDLTVKVKVYANEKLYIFQSSLSILAECSNLTVDFK